MDLTINDSGIEETSFKDTNAKEKIKTVEELLNETDSSSETTEPNVVSEKILNYFPSAIITLCVIILIFVFIHHPDIVTLCGALSGMVLWSIGLILTLTMPKKPDFNSRESSSFNQK